MRRHSLNSQKVPWTCLFRIHGSFSCPRTFEEQCRQMRAHYFRYSRVKHEQYRIRDCCPKNGTFHQHCVNVSLQFGWVESTCRTKDWRITHRSIRGYIPLKQKRLRKYSLSGSQLFCLPTVPFLWQFSWLLYFSQLSVHTISRWAFFFDLHLRFPIIEGIFAFYVLKKTGSHLARTRGKKIIQFVIGYK